MPKPSKFTLILGDVHFPWASQNVLESVYAAADLYQPDLIVQVGDLYENYNFSKYGPSRNLMLPNSEMMLARSGAEEMWMSLHMIAPKAKKYQILGNHDDRLFKKLKEGDSGMEQLVAKSVHDLFKFPNVLTELDSSEELILDTAVGKVVFQHGHRSKLGDHANYNQMHTVCGHSHRGGVVWNRNLQGPFFELNVGWMGNEKSAVFKYGQQNKIRKWTTGFGIIDSLGPRFVAVSA